MTINVRAFSTPIGSVTQFGGTVANIPDKFLPCDGSPVSRTTFAALFNVIGETWGVGDGSTTFNLPDMRGRSPHGVNDGSLPAGPNGSFTTRSAGEQTGNLNTNSAGSHNHTLNPHIHTTQNHQHNIGSDGAHTHNAGAIGAAPTNNFAVVTGGPPATITDSQGAHSHGGITLAGSGSHDVSANASTVNNSSNHNHTITPPSAHIPFIIKASF
jgi:microcystin-dependent protein